MAANKCNMVPEAMPSRWAFQYFKECPEFTGTPNVAVFDIYKAVIVEAFLWGLGTAIGELPPYYVARAGMLCYHLMVNFSELGRKKARRTCRNARRKQTPWNRVEEASFNGET
jgi:hypothetical protein